MNKEKRSYSEIAVFYRANYQSRIYEEALAKSKIPYNIIGDERFYEREEIRNFTQLLRAINNQTKEEAFPSILWLSKLPEERLMIKEGNYETDIKDKRQKDYLTLVNRVFAESENMRIEEIISCLFEASPLFLSWQKEKGGGIKTKIENIRALINAAKESKREELNQFLQKIQLLEELAVVDWAKDFVKLMTVHSAKGLEFPIVFLVGMVEGLFPLVGATLVPKALAEERRLCYVGLSRAKERVYISYPKRIGNKIQEVSRFIPEMLGL